MCDQCLTYIHTSEDAEREDITSAESKYDVVYKAYVNVIASINRKLIIMKEKEVKNLSIFFEFLWYYIII